MSTNWDSDEGLSPPPSPPLLAASVLEPAEGFSLEGVQPYLGSVLEELMEPISSGFEEGRELSEALMDGLCRDLQTNGVTDDLKQVG